LAISILEKPPKKRELGQCILWKNIASIENNPKIQGLFANVRKKFLAAREKIFSGRRPVFQPVLFLDFA
jgi:hypothetical protein